MKTNQKSRVEKARAGLLLNGLSIAAFARRHDYAPNTVVKTLRRYFDVPDAKPWVPKTIEILYLVTEYCKKAGIL